MNCFEREKECVDKKEFKIQRPGSGGDLPPQGGEYSPFPVVRRVNSTHTIMMDEDIMETGTYHDRPRTFPNMRSKPYTPLVLSYHYISPHFPMYLYIYSIIFLHNCFLQIFRILLGINVRVLFILLLLGFGAIFYMGASTSPIIVFVITICILSFLVAIYLMKWVLAKDEGPPEMVQVNIL